MMKSNCILILNLFVFVILPTAHVHVLTSKKIMESSENIFNIPYFLD